MEISAETGHLAPGFELRDQHGTPVSLSGLRGRSVVLIFYPFAFSPVCHGELSAVRDELLPALTGDPARDTAVLAVSTDSVFTLRAWSDREGFAFPLLSDFWPHGETARAYGVLDEERGLAVRGTFIIDRQGVIRWRVVNPVPEARDVASYLKALAEIP